MSVLQDSAQDTMAIARIAASLKTPEMLGMDKKQAIDYLFGRFKQSVMRCALRHCKGNVDNAEDIAAAVWLNVQRFLYTFRGDAAISTWLFRITYNRYLDFYARAKVRQTTADGLSPEEILHLPDPRVQIEADLIRREEHRIALACLRYIICPKQKLVYILYEVEGLTYQEVADIIVRPIGTVKSRLYRARLALRNNTPPELVENWR